MVSDQYLVWIDLEMTGLNLEKDTILEIATIITDNNLTIIAEGPSFVLHQPEDILTQLDEWNTKHHTASGLLDRVRSSTISLDYAQEETLTFIKQYCKANTAPLCGNSVYVDRSFLRKCMPALESFLHYRIIDVSSVKELARRWYGQQAKEFKKLETHRALQDIQESIAELAFYRQQFFK